MPGRIFISYRRDDVPGDARGLRDGLSSRFGKSSIFMDVDNLLAGQRFDEELARALASCDVFIAVIGPRWMEQLKAREGTGERDYVREEIAEALRRRIVVIPVRVGREGQMPPLPRVGELPPDIRDLVLYQKQDVAHERFGRDIADLAQAIVAIRRGPRAGAGGGGSAARWGAVAAGLAAVAVGGGVLAYQLGVPMPWDAASPGSRSAGSDPTATVAAADAARKKKADDAAQAKRKAEESERRRLAMLKAEEDKKRAEADAERRRREAAGAQPRAPTGGLVENLKWRLQTAFPQSLGVYSESAKGLAGQIAQSSDGRFRVEVFSAGMLVPAIEVLDAVARGVLDAGWTLAAYNVGKDRTFGIMSGQLPLGLDASGLVRWAQSAAGKEARDAVFEKYSVYGMPCAVVGPRGLWTRKEIRSLNDLRGLKVRTSGLPAEVARRLGAVPQLLPGGDVFPAFEGGLVDAVEWSTPLLDYKLGLHRIAKYYHYPAWDASSATLIDLVVNRPKWDVLSKSAQAVIVTACRSQLLATLQKVPDAEREGLGLLLQAGVLIRKIPDSVRDKAREAARSEIDSIARESALAKRLWDSLRNFR